MATLGKLVPPYPVKHCANRDCERPLASEDCAGTSWQPPDSAFLYCNLESEKLVVFCDDCARYAELVRPDQFKLVVL